MTKKQKWGIALIPVPFLVLALGLILQIINRFVLTSSGTSNAALNVITLVLGAIGVLTLLPLPIIGIILIVTGAKKPSTEAPVTVVPPSSPVQPAVPQTSHPDQNDSSPQPPQRPLVQ